MSTAQNGTWAPDNGGEATSLSLRDRVRTATREIESQIILETLEKHHWNRRRTAETLRISYRLLMLKMKNCREILDAKKAAE
jgi:DNA-binding NtrC family response regulator